MNLFKKITGVVLAMTTVVSTSTAVIGSVSEVKADENKLSFTVMCDGTMLQENNGVDAFYKQLSEKLDCNITWIRPDHNSYYDYVQQAFASHDMPDVVLLSKDYLEYYAYNGYLWDMKKAWDNSKTKNSGKLSDSAINYIEHNGSAYTSHNKSMYGFSPQRAMGTVTYIKAAELRKAGYDPETIKNANLTFDEYYDILKNIKKSTSADYVLSPPGFYNITSYSNSSTIYLPEFYQDAKWGFYKNSDGEFVDGFTEQAMVDAINRIRTAISDGIIDRSSEYATTITSRNKFYISNGGGSSVFSYYSGPWGNSLRISLTKSGTDNELIAIKPVNNGKYIDRYMYSWAIVDKKDGRQQKIFDKFIDTMLDGRDIQLLWTYGVKGVQWDTKAETITNGNNTNSYKEGEFHMLPKVENPKSLYSKNFIDSACSLREFDDDILDGQLLDPLGKYEYAKEIKEECSMCLENSEYEVSVPHTPALGENIGDINTMRHIVVDNVARGDWTIEKAINEYRKMVGNKVDTILEELNDYTFNEEEEISSITDVIKNNNLNYSISDNQIGFKLLTGVKSEIESDRLRTELGDNVVIKGADGTQLNNNDYVGTGCVIQLINNNQVVDSATVMIKGDTDGTGTIDVLDMETIQKSILGIGEELSGVYKEAALLSGDDTDEVSVLDMEAIQKDILGIEKIN